MNMELILLIAVILLIIFWLRDRKKLQSQITILKNEQDISNKKSENLEYKISVLKERNDSLSKYQGIVDTEKFSKEILDVARQSADSILLSAKIEMENALYEANEIIQQAKYELDQANISAKTIKTQANVDANSFRQNAERLLSNATKEAQIVIEQAIIKAKEIAGSAYKALTDANELEKTVKAMKNIIEGYGDNYLKPTYSLLDDLAQEFSHTEAGEKLKFAREKTRLMIKNGTSAKCDYVEFSRRTTAIAFVLDAFNGKVDSILSNVKKDNYGTLEQRIKDAYQVVNNNGKAFRNAVITEEYENARIDELHWAVITQELKWEEQEEQRRIKEQIREEEKARRDFEKAIRETQKEEALLKKLIEKAQKEVAFASEEQRAGYELKLLDLEGRLKSAEEKNQRALSMAQQTKSGNVYIISNIGSFGENVFKIGMTRRLEPLDRVKELGDASVPFEFDVHSMIYSDNAPALERQLHKKFLRLQMNKVNPRKEFFKVALTDIKDEIDKMNINAKWTMIYEARHYRESLAIEEAISNDIQKQLEWEKYQLEMDSVSIEMDEEIEV